jgi:folate-dependent phosphoribosylglycinamide formyltransferase PurN
MASCRAGEVIDAVCARGQFSGGMDLQVHEAVLKAGRKESARPPCNYLALCSRFSRGCRRQRGVEVNQGCTVHIVDAGVDTGPIVLQKRCAVEPADTPESLKARVQPLEGAAFVEALQMFRIERRFLCRSQK